MFLSVLQSSCGVFSCVGLLCVRVFMYVCVCARVYACVYTCLHVYLFFSFINYEISYTIDIIHFTKGRYTDGRRLHRVYLHALTPIIKLSYFLFNRYKTTIALPWPIQHFCSFTRALFRRACLLPVSPSFYLSFFLLSTRSNFPSNIPLFSLSSHTHTLSLSLLCFLSLFSALPLRLLHTSSQYTAYITITTTRSSLSLSSRASYRRRLSRHR